MFGINYRGFKQGDGCLIGSGMNKNRARHLMESVRWTVH